ncbi:hypothetical protein OEZ85_000657 [Tetradesmus obliquus]|uniref:Uncharacterized protein n=1 Tax=Tetradesmus obliquus TaxID=3088 RepID=A0ABY8UIT0_TETOB|nr:hypothetical protein OEZ85_000657 [Tetradesmus obliquus]
MAGKATAGLTMVSLRVLSKGVMPQTLTGLLLGTVMGISCAGALLLVCFLVAAVVLPRLKQQITDMQEKRPDNVSHSAHQDTAGARGDYSTCSNASYDSVTGEHLKPARRRQWNDETGNEAAAAIADEKAAQTVTKTFLGRVGGRLLPDNETCSITQCSAVARSDAEGSQADNARCCSKSDIETGGSYAAAPAATSIAHSSLTVRFDLADAASCGGTGSLIGALEHLPHVHALRRLTLRSLGSMRRIGRSMRGFASSKFGSQRFSLLEVMEAGIEKQIRLQQLLGDPYSSNHTDMHATRPDGGALPGLYTIASAMWRWPAIGTWYIQLILMAQQTGSALLPIRPLRYPRTTLLTAALAYMAVFVMAFMMALKLRAGPVAFVPLCYALTTCQG